MERTPPPQLQVVQGKHEHKPGSIFRTSRERTPPPQLQVVQEVWVEYSTQQVVHGVKGIQVEHIVYSWDLGVYA